MLDKDLTPLTPDEPLQDIWLQASHEYYSLFPNADYRGSDKHLVCGEYKALHKDRTIHRYCTRIPGHTREHVSGPSDREDAVIWE